MKLVSCSSSKVASAVSPGSILHTSQDVPPPVTPTHHLWSLWPGPQTWLLLHSLCPEKVASCAHTSLWLPERPPEAPTAPLLALLGCLRWGSEASRAGGGLRWHPKHKRCAKYWTGKRGRDRCEGEEGGGGESVVCWQVNWCTSIAVYFLHICTSWGI